MKWQSLFMFAAIGALMGGLLGWTTVPSFAQLQKPALESVYENKWVDRSVLAVDENSFKYQLSLEAQNGFMLNYMDAEKLHFVRKEPSFVYRKETWADKVAVKNLDEFGEFGWELVAVLPAVHESGTNKGKPFYGRKVYFFKMYRQSK